MNTGRTETKKPLGFAAAALVSLTIVLMLFSSGLPAIAAGENTWVDKSIPSVSNPIADIQVKAGDPRRASAVVTGSNNLYSTKDNGNTWSTFASSGNPFLALTESKTNAGAFYSLDTGGNVYKSSNGGEAWTGPASTIPSAVVDINTGAAGGTLIASTGGGNIYYSTNYAVNWTSAASGMTASASTAGDPSTANVFYAAEQAAAASAVYKTVDGGISWNPCTAFASAIHVTSIAILPNGGPVLAANDTVGVNGVYRSNDGGTTWVDSSTGIPGTALVSALCVSSKSPHIAYAATDSGIYASYDSGTTWANITDNLPAATYISISSSGGASNTVYTGTSGGSIYRMNSPYLSDVDPSSAEHGDSITINGTNLGNGTGSYVSFGGVTTTSFDSWTEDGITLDVPAHAQSGNLTVSTPQGTSNPLSFTVITPEPQEYKWYLAEGSTGINEEGAFETWVLVQNPGTTTATVQLTYMTPTGAQAGPNLSIPPNSRQSVDVSQTVPNTWSVSTLVSSNVPVIAERSMYWSTSSVYRQAAHDSIGVQSGSEQWYLAEGSTGTTAEGAFETWVLVQNPGTTTATVQLTYMTPSGAQTGPTLSIPPNSRQSVDVSEEVPNTWSVSTVVSSNVPVIAERSMYWSTSTVYRQAAHDSIGVQSGAQQWYLAEGSTGINEEGAFETWVLVQNPGTTTATVQLTYMTPAGAQAGPSLSIPPNSRQSVDVSEAIPNTWSVSTLVSSNVPVIAERSMYWSTSSVHRQAAHDSIGVQSGAQQWYLAEGSTGINEEGAFETWVLVQNPGTTTATVQLTYMTPSGAQAGPNLSIPPNSRQSVDVSETVPNTWSVSTHVSSNVPVIAERSMYWSTPSVYRQAAHDSIGVAGD